MAVTTKKTFNAVGSGGQSSTTVFTPVSIELNNQDDLDVYVTLSGGTRVLQYRQSTGGTTDSNHPQVNDTTGLYFPAQNTGVTLYNYTLSTDNNTITFNSALPSGAVVSIERRTRDSSSDYTNFAGGSTIRHTDINKAFDESNFTAQEARNKAFEIEGKIFGTEATSTSFIDTNEIVNDAVTADKIADDQINSEHYVDGSIDTAHIGDNQITTAKIAADAITNAKIADNSIDSEHYVDGSIDTAHLADNSVTGAKLAAGTIGTTDIADSTITTAKIADDSVTVNKLANNSVNTGKIVDGNITTAKLAADAVTSGKLADNAVVNANLTSDCVTSDNLADNSVTTVQITDANITSAKIAASAVTTNQLGDDAVTAAKLASNSVVSASIVDGSIVTGDIADDAITSAKIAANAVTTTEIADAELTTLAGMQAGTASILAGGTALTATLTEINSVCDGMGVQSTITNDDTKYPTSGAVVDYVAAQIAPIGGLEVIANDASFPNTQPQAGVVISIADAGGLVVNGSGTSTTGRTVGGSTVTINNINSSYNSSTVTNGVGFLVSSTGSGQIYNFHKSVIRDQDILSISTDINDFANRYRVHNGEPSSNNDDGDLVFDTNANKMKVYDATASAWQEITSTGDFKYLFLCPAGGTGAPTLNGSIATYDLRESSNSGTVASVNSAAQLIVSINGVIQKANTGTSAPAEGFALVDANTIVFGANLASGDSVFIVQIGSAVSIPTPGDNTVSTAKIQNLAVTGDKVATNLDLADNKKIRFGTGNDLQIYHDGSNSFITNSTGDLKVYTDNLIVNDADNGDHHIKALHDGAVELYYDGTLRLKTRSNGNELRGTIQYVEGLLRPWSATGVDLGTDSDRFQDLYLHNDLDLKDDGVIKLGNGDDLKIYHSGDWNYIQSYNSKNLAIQVKDNENAVIAVADGDTQLYYDGTKKLATESWGVDVTGSLVTSNNIRVNSDSHELSVGVGQDLKIYHDSSNSYITNTTGNLIIRDTTDAVYIQAPSILFQDDTLSEDIAKFISDGAVELYYNGVKKFETTSGGISVTGTIEASGNLDVPDWGQLKLGTGDDLLIYHNGSHSYIDNTSGTGNLYIQDQVIRVRSATSFAVDNADGSETALMATLDGAVDLYYDGTKKFETISTGVRASGHVDITGGNHLYLADSGKIVAGAGSDLQIYHDGSHSFIKDAGTGTLQILTDQLRINNAAGSENMIKADEDGAVSLYYNGAEKLSTISQGIKVRGDDADEAVIEIFADQGDDNEDKWRITTTTDGYLHIQSYKFGNWHPALTCFGGGSDIQKPWIQAGVSGVRFDRDQASPTADQWDEYTADGTLHRSWGQAYITADDHLRVRKNGNAENRRFDFRTDTGNAEALNDFLDDQFDFAEFFEWSDGNPDGEDRIGHTVAVDGLTGKIKIATEGDAVIGVVSGTAAFTANCAAMGWHGKYIRDEWGRYRFDLVKDEDGNQLYRDENKKHEKVTLVENPDWDKSKEYYSRDERKEWDKIGIIGQCYVRKTAVIPSSWIKLKEVDSIKDFYLIK